MHDHETAMYHFGKDQAECNVHLIRYLTKNTEETGNLWSKELSDLLLTMNLERQEKISVGVTSFSETELSKYEAEYDKIITKGREEHKKTRGKCAYKEETALLNRLVKYKKNHLLFLYDFDVEFSNNMRERDLRKGKNRQKMSGGFRKLSGIEMYCIIMSIIETCKRKKMLLFENIQKIFSGTPAIF